MDNIRASLLRNAKQRPLHIALAHELVRAKVGDNDRMELLNRLFVRLNPFQQLACRAEIHECRSAVRAHHMAVVS